MAFVILDPPKAGAAPHAPQESPVPTESPAPQRKSGRRVAVGHVVLAALAVFSIFPVYWMFATALRRPEDSLSGSPLPWPLSTENFRYVFDTIPMLSMLLNTFAMAFVVAVSQLFVALLASYGFARWNFFGKQLLFLLFVGSWLVPFQVTMIPNYLLISQMGLLDTVAGVVIPNLCSAFGVMLLRQHMEAFPRELLDASEMDGQGAWAALWKVIVPNMRPALAALGIMLFISAWNEYLWPSLILRNSDALVQIGIRSFLGAEGNNWGAVMAAAGIACLPIFLIYIFLQRHVVDAFVRSGLK
jgi:multiple sugar transport system permease protein/sn-glycerol 3-phosphate transport system permease protein